MYYEEYGPPPAKKNDHDNYLSSSSSPSINKDVVALSLHGGPGAASFPNHARFFNTSTYNRIILYDQRGCGKSEPRGETQSNTLYDLVQDIETLRKHLGIEKWNVILGGSWGSTLALAYAQSYPDRVSGIVLRGVCLFRDQEIEWLFGDDIRAENISNSDSPCLSQIPSLSRQWQTFKDVGKDFINTDDNTSSEEKNKIKRKTLHAYYDYLLGDHPWDKIIASKRWMTWEMSVSKISLPPNDDSKKVICSNDNLTLYVSPSREISWSKYKMAGHTEEMHLEIETTNNTDVSTSFRRWPKFAISTDTRKLQRRDHNAVIPGIRQLGVRPNLPKTMGAENNQPSNLSDDEVHKFIPAQAMLTCFYSVNNQAMMNNFNLLSSENIERIRHIPCIAIQGGMDLICPPDSALDLKDVWSEMELRIVTTGRHSQYDPQIMSELIKATDSITLMS